MDAKFSEQVQEVLHETFYIKTNAPRAGGQFSFREIW